MTAQVTTRLEIACTRASADVDTPPAVARSDRQRRTRQLLADRHDAILARDALAQRRCEAEVVIVNLPVAQAVATRYRHRGVDDDDLEQLAYEGLVKAARRYEADRAQDFLSFAVPTIRGEIQRFFRDHGWTVRPPRRIQDLQWRLNRATGPLQQSLGREPTVAEVCADLGVDRAQYDQAAQAYGSFAPLSLDAPLTADGDLSWADLFPHEDREPEEFESRLVARAAVTTLAARDQHIVYLRFVLDLTQREIGEQLGVTQMQVSRLLTRILGQLREQLIATSEAG